jgi:glycosyltransferase involved in cell wall biosynthesis
MRINQNKLVTVIIPTFKRADELKKALTSVLLQDFKSLDVIIVDDNVQEEESNKVKEICINFGVNYIKNFRRKGGCGSRNSGILSTSSKYISFLDDDDLWLANKLEIQSMFLDRNSNYSAVYSSFYNYNLDANVLRASETRKDLSHSDLLKGNCPASTSIVMVNRKLILEAGLFDENLPSFQDYDMWLRLTIIKPIGFLDKKLAIFTQHSGDRVSINLKKRFQGLDLIICKWGKEIKKYNNISRFVKKFKSVAYESNALAFTGHSYKKMITFRVFSLIHNKYCLNRWKGLLVSLFGARIYYMLLRLKLRNTLVETKQISEYLKLIDNKSKQLEINQN